MKEETIYDFLKQNHLPKVRNNYDNIINIQNYISENELEIKLDFELTYTEYVKLVSRKLKYYLKDFYRNYGKSMTKTAFTTLSRIITTKLINYIAKQLKPKPIKKTRTINRQIGGISYTELLDFTEFGSNATNIQKLMKNVIKYAKQNKYLIKK